MELTARYSTALADTGLGVADRRALLAVTAFAFALRVVFVTMVRPAPVSDFEWYYQHAIQIVHGLGFTTNGYPTAYWPLGWPYFLAGIFSVFGPNVYVAEVTQAVLGALTVTLVFLIAQRVAGSTAAVAAALAYAVLPSAIEWTAVLASEPLYTFLWALITYIWICTQPHRYGTFAFSGLLAGAAALVRPTAIFLWGLLFLYRWFAGNPRTLRAVLLPPFIVAVFAVAAIAPDLVRNYRIFHTFVLISNNGGVTLWTGNNPHFRPADTDLYDARLTAMVKDPRTELAADQLAGRMAAAYIRAHPGHVAAMALPKLKPLYANDDDGPTQYAFHTTRATLLGRVVLIVNRAIYYPLLLLALAGVILCAIAARGTAPVHPGWALLFLNILYNTLPFLILPAYDRYHYPSMPYFAVFAGIAIAAALARRRVADASSAQTI